jgi:hypothetical protein
MDKHNVHKCVMNMLQPPFLRFTDEVLVTKFYGSCLQGSYMYIHLLKHSFSVTTSKRLQRMLKVSILSFNARCCTSEQRLSYPPEDSSCCTNDLKSMTYPLLQVLDIIDFCSINSGLQMLPEIKV